MANVTDPLARALHGTNPQNLVEYITRQKIYDSRYWKEECFGLNATDIVEKATKLSTIGGSYGGNMKPCHFLCLVLKMLQIQPSDDIVEELVQNEDFKYVRALGAFYLRLTGRPKDIYELLEPLYNDYRKLRVRTITDWRILCVDEFVDELLRNSAVCGISLPRLPKRAHLEEAGYIEPRKSVLCGEAGNAEKYLIGLAERGSEVARNALIQRGIWREDGDENCAAEVTVDAEISADQKDEDSTSHNGPIEGTTPQGRSRSRSRSRSWGRRTREGDRDRDRRDRDRRDDRRRNGDRGYHRSDVDAGSSGRHGELSDERRSRRYDDVGRDEHRHRRRSEEDQPRYDDWERRERHQRTGQRRSRYGRDDEAHSTYHRRERTKISDRDEDKDNPERGSRSKPRDREKKKKEKKEKFGSLFKEKSKPTDLHGRRRSSPSPNEAAPKEGSEEYWNEQRAKLGLKPLRK